MKEGSKFICYLEVGLFPATILNTKEEFNLLNGLDSLGSGQHPVDAFSNAVLGCIEGAFFNLVGSFGIDSHYRVNGGVKVFD